MNNISFDVQSITNYLNNQGVVLEQSDSEKLNSIFSQCDTESENGAKKADGKLTNGEVPVFFKMVSEQLQNIATYIYNFQNQLAGKSLNNARNNTQQLENPEFQEIESTLSPEEQRKFERNLQEAKEIVLNNKEMLELSENELTFIQNATLRSENNKGAARKASSTELIFNYNGIGGVLEVGNIVKIMIHEATHMTLNSTQNSKNEERQCETRAITSALKLIKNGKINHFTIYPPITTQDFINETDNTKLNSTYIEPWLNTGYAKLPEN